MNTTEKPFAKIVISILLFFWTLSVFLPGSYNVDSWNHYNQMIHSSYHDWLGPALPFTWRILWLLTGGFASLFLFQMALYWVFMTILVWDTKIETFKYWLTMLLAIVFIFIPQYIMRDSLMVVCWGPAVLLLVKTQDESKHNKIALLGIAFLLAYGLWLRPNAIIGIIPLIWAGVAILLKHSSTIWKRLVISFIVFAVFLSTIQIVTYNVLSTRKTYPSYILKLLDLSGISKLSGKNCMPDCIKSYKDFNYDQLMQEYTPATIVHIYWPVNNPKHLFPYAGADLDRCVTEAWRKSIIEHPLLYIENRTEGFLYYLHIKHRVKAEDCWNAVIWIDPNNPLHMQIGPNRIHDLFQKLYDHLARISFFDPWLWLVLNLIAFLCFAFYYKKTKTSYWYIHACIQISGVLYMLSQFFVYQDDREFRFTYWNVFVALVGFSTWSGKIIWKRSDDTKNTDGRAGNFPLRKKRWAYYVVVLVILGAGCLFVNEMNCSSRNYSKTLDYTYFNKDAAFNLNRKEVVALWGNTPVLSNPISLDKGRFKITVSSKGTPAGNIYPHINLFVNGVKLGAFFTTSEYALNDFYFDNLQNDKIIINFSMDNDFSDPATNEDRNAFVQYVFITRVNK